MQCVQRSLTALFIIIYTFPVFLVLLIIVVFISHDLHVCYTAMVRKYELGVNDNRKQLQSV